MMSIEGPRVRAALFVFAASQLNIALQRKIFPRIAWQVVRYYMYPPLVADATVPPRGNQEFANEV